jgi:hypothetical protein
MQNDYVVGRILSEALRNNLIKVKLCVAAILAEQYGTLGADARRRLISATA